MVKRKIAALVFCFLLVFQLAAPPAKAAEEVYFVAAGNEVQPLSDKTMPFWKDGYLYIPASVFSGNVRKALGVSQVESRGTVILYSAGDHSLMFDLSKSYAKDIEGNVSYPGGVRRNGIPYVPAFLVAKYFGLDYSVTQVQSDYNGYLVWLRQPGFGLKDTEFADAASYSLAARYAEYQKNKGTSGSMSGSTGGYGENGAATGKKIYLCLQASSLTDAAMDVLDRYEMQAAFFCTTEFLAEQGDLLRRMVATGHTVGLLADASDTTMSVLEQLAEGNRLLEMATCGKTRLAYVRNGEDALLQEVENAGYCCLKPDLDRSGYDLRSESSAASLLQRISTRRGDASVWLGETASIAGLRAFLNAAESADDLCLALTELI